MGQTLLFVNVGLVYKLHSYINIDNNDPTNLIWIKAISIPYEYIYIHIYVHINMVGTWGNITFVLILYQF
jgi:hypothetical protein